MSAPFQHRDRCGRSPFNPQAIRISLPDRKRRVVLRDRQMTADVRTLSLQRGWQFGLNFYLQRELQEWNPSEPQGYVLASPSGIQELRRTRIQYQVLDDTSFPAILVRIRASENKSKKATAPESPNRTFKGS